MQQQVGHRTKLDKQWLQWKRLPNFKNLQLRMLRFGTLILSLFVLEIRHATSAVCDNLPRYKKGDPCDPMKIRFYLGDDEIVFDYNRNKVVSNNPNYRSKVPMTLIAPGIAQSHNNIEIRKLSDAYNEAYNDGDPELNVIVGEYSALVNPACYKESEDNLEYIAFCMGKVLNTLKPPEIHGVGYEMGASLLTVVAKSYEIIFIKLTYLDPYAAIYGMPNKEYVTAKNISFYKDCYHTAGNRFAIECGNSDWYMNLGLRPMPGCPKVKNDPAVGDLCSSLRSLEYFQETIMRPAAMWGFRCEYVKPNEKKYCAYKAPWYLAGEFIEYKTTGKFQVYTNAKSPYGQGKPKN